MTSEATGRGPYTGEWFDKRNKRRRERYVKDANYRETANVAARHGYRNSSGTLPPTDPMDNIHMLNPQSKSFVGHARTLKDGRALLTVSKTELALVFDRPAKQVQQWAGSDTRIPTPVIKARRVLVERSWQNVYSLAEAKAIVTSLAPFLKDLLYFRQDHKDAINACREAVSDVRVREKLV